MTDGQAAKLRWTNAIGHVNLSGSALQCPPHCRQPQAPMIRQWQALAVLLLLLPPVLPTHSWGA